MWFSMVGMIIVLLSIVENNDVELMTKYGKALLSMVEYCQVLLSIVEYLTPI